jgi:POT family proton-dependent oligopeptide transporter
MGINLGAFIAPLVCGYLGQQINWHLGFGAAGVGMTLGVVQYLLGSKYLGDAGLHPAPAASLQAFEDLKRKVVIGAIVVVVGVAAFAIATYTGTLPITVNQVADGAGYFLLIATVAFFGWLFLGGDWTPDERKRLYAIGVFFLAAALFWSVFEQAGSTLNLFADRDTSTELFGWPFPSSWFQSLNSLFIIALAPVFAWLWVRLGSREPSTAAKFAVGLIFVGAGFGILIVAARFAAQGIQVSPMWLAVTYLLHTIGELSLSPVGLSAMTKLAPARIAGLMMGVWFLATSVGNFIAGRLSGFYEAMPLPDLFGVVTLFAVVAGVIMFVLVPTMKRLMGEVN